MEAGCALARMGGAGGVIHAFIIAGFAGSKKKLQLPNLLELVKPHKTFRCDQGFQLASGTYR